MLPNSIETVLRTLDSVFSEARMEPFEMLCERLHLAERSLLASYKDDPRTVLELRRGVTERELIGGITRQIEPRECIMYFNQLESLGYESPARRWLVGHLVVRYLRDTGTAGADVESIVTEIKQDLEEMIDQCQGALESIHEAEGSQ